MNFASHSQVVPLCGIIPPRRVETAIQHLGVNPACRAAIDAFADEQLRQERARRADLASEERTEGRVIYHRFDWKGE